MQLRNTQLLALAAITVTGVALMTQASNGIRADTLVWTGATNGHWDTTATDLNWNDSTSSTNGVAYTDGSGVQFSGGATTTAPVVGSGSGVSPASVDFASGAGSYSLTNFTGDTSGISGTSGLTLDTGYTGTVTLNSPDTYSGGTSLNGGTLLADSAAALGTGAISFNGGTLNNNTNATINNSLVINTGDTGTIIVGGSSATKYGSLGGDTATATAPAATLTGGGTLNLVAYYVRNNVGGDWSAFTGTVNVTATDNNANLGFNGIDNALSAHNANGNRGFYLNNGTLNLDGTSTDSLTFSFDNEQHDSTLNGVNAVIGALTGTQYSTISGFSYGGPPYHVLNYVIGGTNASTTFAGALSGATGSEANFYKIGSGSLTIQGGDSFAGSTEVNGGTLVLDGAVTNSTGITVDATAVGVATAESDMRFAAGNGGTLAGNGTITANITNNGTLSPGDPAVSMTGSLTVTGNVDNEGTMSINIGAAGASSLLAITGGLTLGANSVLNLTPLTGGFDGSSYTIATFTPGDLTGTFLTTTGLGTGYSVNYNNLAGTITVAVPEPATVALFAAAGVGLLLLRKRKTA